MTSETCGCGSIADETNAATADGETDVDRWVTDPFADDADLPADLERSMARFLGEDSVETLEEFFVGLRQEAGGGGISAEQLCHAGEPTGHRATTGDETYHFQCFYDAVVLARLIDSPVDIRTETPDGEVVEAHADGSGTVTATPETAVLSFGIHRDVELPGDDGRSLPEVYGAICPFVKAFKDRASYEEWAATTEGATVATPLAEATDIATIMIGEE